MNGCDDDRQRAVLACMPRLDPLATHLQGVARMLACSGVEARVEHCAAGRMEIRVSLTLDGVQLEGGLDLAEWCALQFDDGDRLAFGEIDPAYLLPMLESEANATLRRVGGLPVSTWRALEVRHPATSELRLRLAICPRWPALSLTAWPSARYTQCLHPAPWRASFDGVPIPLSLVVGRSRVTRQLIRRLVRGDVLLVQRPEWQVRVAQTTLGVFSVSRQEWKMETFERSRRRDTPLSAGGTPSPVEMSKLDDVPVEAEFLLASHTLSLAELRGLHAGATFALARHPVPCPVPYEAPAGASHEERAGAQTSAQMPRQMPSGEGVPAQGYLVDVRINGLPVAQGELVALGDQLAVQIVRLSGKA